MRVLRAKFWAQWVGVVALGCFVAGCATTRVDWNSRIGNYSYEQAVLELGPPDKSASLKDGTLVAEWLVRHGYAYGYSTFGPGYYPWSYGPFYPEYTAFNTPDSFVRLTFGPDEKLKAWKSFYK